MSIKSYKKLKGAVGIYKLQYFDLRLIENFIDETWVD